MYIYMIWYVYIIKTYHIMMLNTIGLIFSYMESFFEWIRWQRSIRCLIMTRFFRCKPRPVKMYRGSQGFMNSPYAHPPFWRSQIVGETYCLICFTICVIIMQLLQNTTQPTTPQQNSTPWEVPRMTPPSTSCHCQLSLVIRAAIKTPIISMW